MVGEVTPVNVKVLFFASAREAAGESAADCQVHSGTPDTAALRKMLAEKYPKLQPLVTDEDNITLALNEEYVPAGKVLPLKDCDVIALIPPISGG